MRTSESSLLALSCVLAISAGQVLFKMVGNQTRHGLGLRAFILLGVAGLLYVGATLVWIYVLRFNPLIRVYPYMALSFVIVPIASCLVFGESVSVRYIMGSAIMICGLVVLTSG